MTSHGSDILHPRERNTDQYNQLLDGDYLVTTKLFLSHAHDEAELALSFAHWLEGAFSNPVEVICTSRPDHRIKRTMVTTGIVKHLRNSKAALSLLTPGSIRGPWLYYEMGAAHALDLLLVPCLARGLRFSDLPPQAWEYQGAELCSADNLAKLVRDLAQVLGLEPADAVDVETMADARSADLV